ncbi:MAG: NrfD/PsrC family molybdoenzyme membrane anchor subunit, partial [Dehalococcoidia bacterium]|nr:NrfD/PsrC family molybdoenzyme membrane anchor subunit [Dehalococcoidia bacterium]
ALCLIILAPLLLHGGVIPWLFSNLPSMPGYYSAIMGPNFLALAIVSAFGVVTVVAYIFRRVHKWHDIFPDNVFRSLALAMLFAALASLWLQLQLNINGLYAPALGLERSTEAKLETPAYWLAIGLIAVSFLYLGAQVLFPRLFSVGRTAVVGVLVVAAVFVEKSLFVVEGLMHPAFGLYEPGTYFPSWVEISGVVGTIFIVILFFAVMVKVIPVVEVRVLEER